jgi:hypothetical protein
LQRICFNAEYMQVKQAVDTFSVRSVSVVAILCALSEGAIIHSATGEDFGTLLPALKSDVARVEQLLNVGIAQPTKLKYDAG